MLFDQPELTLGRSTTIFLAVAKSLILIHSFNFPNDCKVTNINRNKQIIKKTFLVFLLYTIIAQATKGLFSEKRGYKTISRDSAFSPNLREEPDTYGARAEDGRGDKLKIEN